MRSNSEAIVPQSSEPVMPALSPTEWLEFGNSKPFFERLACGGRPFGPPRRFTEEQKLHALAALALYRHPAVFTHDELDALEAATHLLERRRNPGDPKLVAALQSLHAKASALLPPRGIRMVPAE